MHVRLALIGLGNIGRRFLELLVRKESLLKERFDLAFSVVAVADSSGGVADPAGFDPNRLIALKREGGKISAHYPEAVSPIEMLDRCDADVLIEVSPTDLKTGGLGLEAIRRAFDKGWNVVTANKGPLVLAHDELNGTAKAKGVKFLYSATVTGGLPTLNVGRRDLSPCDIGTVEGIVNSTTNFILNGMNAGETFEQALKRAQDVGFAEADPTLDVDGWDAANKLTIIANTVLRRPTKLSELDVTGIRDVTTDDLARAKAEGRVFKLIAKAEKIDGDYRFSVKPTAVEADHPLARLGADWLGVVYHTDINGTILCAIRNFDPYPTAAAVLEDTIAMYVS